MSWLKIIKITLFEKCLNVDRGAGYAWSQPDIRISKGDFVTWSWLQRNAPTGLFYKVEQVYDYLSTTPLPDGFISALDGSPGTLSV